MGDQARSVTLHDDTGQFQIPQRADLRVKQGEKLKEPWETTRWRLRMNGKKSTNEKTRTQRPIGSRRKDGEFD
jgi:hypothetical protein